MQRSVGPHDWLQRVCKGAEAASRAAGFRKAGGGRERSSAQDAVHRLRIRSTQARIACRGAVFSGGPAFHVWPVKSVLRRSSLSMKASNQTVSSERLICRNARERSAIGAVILRVGEHNCGRLQSSGGSHESWSIPPFNRLMNIYVTRPLRTKCVCVSLLPFCDIGILACKQLRSPEGNF